MIKNKIIFLTGECEHRLKGKMRNEEYDLHILSFFSIKYRQTYNFKVMKVFFTLPKPPKFLNCCDGASKGNPELAGYGFVARAEGRGDFLIAVAGDLGVATNYFAEIISIVCAGEWAMYNHHLEVISKSDSKVVVLAFQKNELPWFIIT